MVAVIEDTTTDSDSSNVPFIQECQNLGLKTSAGRTRRSLVLDYLTKKLQVDGSKEGSEAAIRDSIKTNKDASVGLAKMADQLGDAIICLIPKEIAQKFVFPLDPMTVTYLLLFSLNKWTLSKMEVILPLLMREFPEFLAITKWLEVHVYAKIRNGHPIRVNRIQLDESKTIYQMLLDTAPAPAPPSDTTMTDA